LKSAVSSSNISFVIGVSSVATVLFLPIFHLLLSLGHPQFEQCCFFEDTYFLSSLASHQTPWQTRIVLQLQTGKRK